MNNDNRQQSRARRRPNSVSRSSSAVRDSSVRQTQSNYANTNNNYRFTSGRTSRTSGNTSQRTPARRVTSLTAEDRRKLQKQQEKRLTAERKEAAWQSEVVRTRGGPDIVMLVLILILTALGTIMVFSSSYPLAISKGYDSDYYIMSQIRFLIIGGIAMAVLTAFPIKWYKNWLPIIAYIVSAAFLAYTAVAGVAEGVTSRWIDLGFISFQPSELMKVSIILMLAWYAEKYADRMKDISKGFYSYRWNTLWPCLILGGACILVLAGRHLSGTIIVGLIGVLMLIVAGSRIRWLLTLVPFVALIIGVFLSLFPYAMERLTSFFGDDASTLDELWQTTQSVYAIGSGGLFGLGLGQSRQKYHYLGNAHTDFIFSIWCEETGFIGAIALIVLYILFIWRGYTIAIKAPDKFTMLTAFGITTHVGLQAFLNMFVASDIMPNTGITLPFFSYGGSSLVVLLMEMGVLLCISRQSYKKKKDLERDELRMRAGLD